jgi:hypothetical protein
MAAKHGALNTRQEEKLRGEQLSRGGEGVLTYGSLKGQIWEHGHYAPEEVETQKETTTIMAKTLLLLTRNRGREGLWGGERSGCERKAARKPA